MFKAYKPQVLGYKTQQIPPQYLHKMFIYPIPNTPNSLPTATPLPISDIDTTIPSLTIPITTPLPTLSPFVQTFILHNPPSFVQAEIVP